MNSRKGRGVTQNIYLIETFPTDDDNIKKFDVMGSTGNVYTVTIKSTPECTCPDYKLRQNRCKHIYFILLRVMKTDNEDEDEYTTEELLEMYSNIPRIASNLIVDEEFKGLYKKLSGTDGEDDDDKKEVVKRKSEDDICPICLDDLDNTGDLDYCKYSCGKYIHKKCFQMWSKKNKATCVYCRNAWISTESTTSQAYVNLLSRKTSR